MQPLRILFFSHYFPPEGNAPASRVHALCKRWVRAGHEVTVITCAPNVPNGQVYEGYQNRLSQRETLDGIEVLRVWTYIAANKGTSRRIANFVSYAATATLRALLLRAPDVIIATSPQFFCGWAGVLTSWLKRRPLVLEIRDIWPESILAVGAMQRGPLIGLLEKLELQMYAAAREIVTVGNGYKQQLLDKGVPASAMTVITNGVDSDIFQPMARDERLAGEFDVQGKFVCAYIGTIGMASGLQIVLRAAQAAKQRGLDDLVFLLVGDGAEREELEHRAREMALGNVRFTGRLDKSLMPKVLSVTDCCLVHLRNTELFKSVLPSKIFEALAMRKPVILGVGGDAARVVRETGGGIVIEPENHGQLLDAIARLRADPSLVEQMGSTGEKHVNEHYDRDVLARDYEAVLQRVTRTEPVTQTAMRPPTRTHVSVPGAQ